MTPRLKCPICDSPQTEQFLHRAGVPVHQHLVMPDPQSAVSIARGDLTLRFCHKCGFVYNATFDASLLDYGEGYDNAQGHSPVFSAYVDDLTNRLVLDAGVREATVIEVGCGQGNFLRKLVNFPDSDLHGIGFDPAYNGPLTDADGRLRFEKRFYGPECADLHADVVVCRHVIEHVPDPLELLKAIHQALAGSKTARVFFETPRIEWILRGRVVWDFFYEHCSLFSDRSLVTAFRAAGFEMESVRHAFGDQYLWLEATLARGPARTTYQAGEVPGLAREYARDEAALLTKLKAQVCALKETGAVALWGAGAKGVTLANLIDPNCQSIACVVDLNPAKQGKFLPGTGHPIVDYHQLAKYGVKTAVLMNPNYREENLALLHTAKINVTLVDLE